MTFFRPLLVLVATFALTGCVHARQADCPSRDDARAEIERAIHDFFDALRKEDQGAFQRLVTGSFYAFDVGKRFDGPELFDVIKDAHAQGVQINWSLGAIDTKLQCDVAWSAWENVGSAGIPPDLEPVRWLESAVLIRENGDWKIDFFHSQRAAEN